jgi:hypothetical protein
VSVACEPIQTPQWVQGMNNNSWAKLFSFGNGNGFALGTHVLTAQSTGTPSTSVAFTVVQ